MTHSLAKHLGLLISSSNKITNDEQRKIDKLIVDIKNGKFSLEQKKSDRNNPENLAKLDQIKKAAEAKLFAPSKMRISQSKVKFKDDFPDGETKPTTRNNTERD